MAEPEQLYFHLVVHHDGRSARIPDGTPFIRDQDNPCFVFEPGEPVGDCDTDGHYICEECKHLDPNSEYMERRRE